MGRRPEPAIRQRILAACTDHALEHGLPDRLEPLVLASGTSARMLLYHFGTRDALLRAVLESARSRQLEALGGLLRGRPGEKYATTLEHAWSWLTGPEGQPFLRVFGPLRDSGSQQLLPGFRRAATQDWLAPLAEGLRRTSRPELATLVLAVLRGLLLDLDATGDRDRADAAFGHFLDVLRTDEPA